MANQRLTLPTVWVAQVAGIKGITILRSWNAISIPDHEPNQPERTTMTIWFHRRLSNQPDYEPGTATQL
jgi:hypothetical protein